MQRAATAHNNDDGVNTIINSTFKLNELKLKNKSNCVQELNSYIFVRINIVDLTAISSSTHLRVCVAFI